MKTRRAGRALLWWCCALAAASAGSMSAGQFLPASLGSPGAALELVSCGLRDVLWLRFYAAGLYLPRGADESALTDATQPKAVRMVMIDPQFMPPRIPAKWRAALARGLDARDVQRVQAVYDGLTSRDVVTFNYVPGEGVTLRLNNETIVDAPGHGVIDAILAAWAEGTPVALKAGALLARHPCAPGR